MLSSRTGLRANDGRGALLGSKMDGCRGAVHAWPGNRRAKSEANSLNAAGLASAHAATSAACIGSAAASSLRTAIGCYRQITAALHHCKAGLQNDQWGWKIFRGLRYPHEDFE
jgi:hypothetical protein